jgi:Iap family predicted aminopeptidase
MRNTGNTTLDECERDVANMASTHVTVKTAAKKLIKEEVTWRSEVVRVASIVPMSCPL